jgi:hypothetical protein
MLPSPDNETFSHILLLSYQAAEINKLDYCVSQVVSGRKIAHLIHSLKEVQEFEAIYSSLQVKTFIAETMTQLTTMVRAISIREKTLSDLDIVRCVCANMCMREHVLFCSVACGRFTARTHLTCACTSYDRLIRRFTFDFTVISVTHGC